MKALDFRNIEFKKCRSSNYVTLCEVDEQAERGEKVKVNLRFYYGGDYWEDSRGRDYVWIFDGLYEIYHPQSNGKYGREHARKRGAYFGRI